MNTLRVTIVAAFLAVAPLSAAVAASDDVESGDAMVARIVAQYDRAALDRGGWDNPYLSSVAAGNPVVAASVGSGVTLVAATNEETTSDDSRMSPMPSSPKAGDASEEHGAGSGEPENNQQSDVQAEDDFLKSIWTNP
jgi:hypothetical protein